MAKIYETRADLERDKLTDEAKTQRKSQNALIGTGIMGGSAAHTTHALFKSQAAEAAARSEPVPAHGFGKFINAVLIGLSAISIVLGFQSRSKAREAEKKLDALGPSEIVLPKDMPVEEALSHITDKHGTISHVDRVEKTSFTSVNR